MAYTDKLFLAVFVALLVAARLLKNRPALKEWVIVAFGLALILSWGAPSLLTFLAIATVNYGAAILIARSGDKRILAAAIAIDLLALATFKYRDFLGADLAAVSGTRLPVFTLGIPLAISFYTFHVISYLVDLRAGKAALVGPRKYIFYLGFFPHVIAGPIVRPWQLMPQAGKVRVSRGDGVIGLHHLAVGMFLKLVVADNIAGIIDPVWDGTAAFALTSADRIAAAILYYCQIYADFAGYTLMALGMARLLGYRLPPNFRQPMFAASLSEFWRRWHITLSRWLRDYLYRPLGGNRKGPGRTLANLMITMFLGGLWHGAGWGFAVWGLMHGAGLAAERLLGRRNPVGALRPVWWLFTQVWVTIAWVFFRAPDLGHAGSYLAGLVPLDGASFSLHAELGVGFLFAAGAVLQQLVQVATARRPHQATTILAVSTAVAITLVLVVASPARVFIYFRF